MDELYSTQAAAEFLSREFLDGGDSTYWSTVLINNRRADRAPVHRIPFSRIGNGAFYTLEDLTRFVEFEKGRRVGNVKLTGRAAEALQAFGIGAKGGGATGRSFTVSSVTLQVDESTGKPFVRLISSEPLMVYRLELDQASALAVELANAAKAGERVMR